MANQAAIAVVGLKETRKAFRDFGADNGWRGPFKDAFGTVAGVVQDEAQSRARQTRRNLAGGAARLGSKGVASIKGKGTTTAATLTAFKGIPWGPGSNFGTTGAHPQFPAKTTPDYFLYAGVAAKREQINNEFLEAIDYALEQAFPD